MRDYSSVFRIFGVFLLVLFAQPAQAQEGMLEILPDKIPSVEQNQPLESYSATKPQSTPEVMQRFGDALAELLNERNITVDEAFAKDEDTLVIDPKFVDEAMYYGIACNNDESLNNYYDCQCLSVKFLDKRLEFGPEASRERVARSLQSECKQGTNVAGLRYSECMATANMVKESNSEEADSFADNFFEEHEKFCSCFGNEYGKMFENHRGEVTAKHHRNYRSAAILRCQNPQLNNIDRPRNLFR